MTQDILDALNALNGKFGKDLYLAKSDTCMAAFNALKEATTTEQKLNVVGKYVREWIDRSAAAIRFWTPKYVALAYVAGFAGKDKWGWVKENVAERLQGSCTGPEFPGPWGGPITTWEPLEWWVRNACNEAPTFLILRNEPLMLPQWLRKSTKPASDPIDYYRMILTAELGREVEWALDHAKIEAAISSTPSNLQIAEERRTDGEVSALPVSLGQWAEEVLPQAKQVAGLTFSGRPEDELRLKFPRFFAEVIDCLYEVKKQGFFSDAQRRKLCIPELLDYMAQAKSIAGATLGDHRKKYRQNRAKTAPNLKAPQESHQNTPLNTPK